MRSIKLSSKAAILEAAFELWARDPSASLATIAERAGVGRATLHRHFQGREDLLREMAVSAMAEMDAVVEAAAEGARSYTDALRRIMEAVVPLANRQWFLVGAALEEHPALAADYERQARELQETVRKAQEEGGFAADVPAAWIAEAFNNLIFTAWTMVRKGEATPKQAAGYAWRTLSRGTGGNP